MNGLREGALRRYKERTLVRLKTEVAAFKGGVCGIFLENANSTVAADEGDEAKAERGRGGNGKERA